MRDYCYYCNIYRIFFFFILFYTLFCLSWIAFNKSIVVSSFGFSNFREPWNRSMLFVKIVVCVTRVHICIISNAQSHYSQTLKKYYCCVKTWINRLTIKLFFGQIFIPFHTLNWMRFIPHESQCCTWINALKHTTNGYVFRHFISRNAVYMHFEPI